MPAPVLITQESTSEKLLPMNALKQSYDHAKKHLQDGVTVIQESITVIKDEFFDIYDKAASMVNKMAMPVNNFLKDLTQIEAEFQAELASSHPSVSHSSCNIIPLEEALKGRMEENY